MMNNAFEILGIRMDPVLDEETLRDAFRAAGKPAHPDSGGSEDGFAALRTAFETLSSPSKRLRHWLELHDVPIESRGTVTPELMDLFASIGGITQQAESVIRKREDARSALALALTERAAQNSREQIEQALVQVEAAITRECDKFPRYREQPESIEASTTVRNLGFLEKWRASLRSVFSRLA